MKTHTRHQRTAPGHVVRRAVVTAAAGVAISGAAFATVAVLVDQFQLEMSYGTSETDVEASGALGAAQDLVERHDCWTSPSGAPADMAGRRPGHVIVTTVDEPATATYSAELVDRASDDVRTARHSDLWVHAFCR